MRELNFCANRRKYRSTYKFDAVTLVNEENEQFRRKMMVYLSDLYFFSIEIYTIVIIYNLLSVHLYFLSRFDRFFQF